MFYRISLIINTSIAALFIILATIGMATDKNIQIGEVLAIAFIYLLYLVFLWFDIICFKMNRYNKENNLVSPALKTTGNVLFVVNIIAAAIIMFCTVASGLAALTVGNPSSGKSMWPFYLSFILVFFLSGATAIINCVFFKKAIKKNSLFVTDFINDIGEPA